MLTSYELVANLIASTTTAAGLRVEASLDQASYPTGVRVSDAELANVNLIRHELHGEWNYTVSPQSFR